MLATLEYLREYHTYAHIAVSYRITESTLEADTEYQGLAQMHANSLLPKNRSKNHPMSKQDRKEKREIAKKRIFVEHAIRFVKRFRILSERYRNRRKRFALRFALIAGICNFDRVA